jgi:hypothetical protein
MVPENHLSDSRKLFKTMLSRTIFLVKEFEAMERERAVLNHLQWPGHKAGQLVLWSNPGNMGTDEVQILSDG